MIPPSFILSVNNHTGQILGEAIVEVWFPFSGKEPDDILCCRSLTTYLLNHSVHHIRQHLRRRHLPAPIDQIIRLGLLHEGLPVFDQ
jgi:hypothetical protein